MFIPTDPTPEDLAAVMDREDLAALAGAALALAAALEAAEPYGVVGELHRAGRLRKLAGALDYANRLPRREPKTSG